ncbi:GGDEF/EAL domain-containing response regulator [Endozoicomonas arenosclerae]|uniref:GGDEF/EAL domain-containing response regulator n=1 Tax=Endozoicomonas arenosclerae TaxID=1633495 RepID=UPI000780B1E2|nr:EAL domain-containing response regulator [Endozoicomonas arenosclerae]
MKGTFSSLNILIVEDHDFQRMIAEQTVKGLGVKQLMVAADGYQALEKLEKHSVADIVICDLDMPGMDGIQFLGHLADRNLAKAVILASALEPSIVRTVEDLAVEHGLKVLGALPKPISLERLRELMELYFGDEPDVAPRQEVQATHFTEKELEEAIDNDQFELFHQPKVMLQSGRMVATEALCRWNHPKTGLISPAHFIPMLESTGLITKLTYKLFDQAITQIKHWQDEGRAIAVAVNLSAIVLSDTSLPDQLYEKVRAQGLAPELLILEITESSLIQNAAKALESLARLKMKGFSLSIDDFGTGYSSMQQLNRIPFSELKIDRSFVQGACDDKTRKAIIEANIGLAHTLKMSTVAEGIETADEWQLLNELNCDMAQGYFIAKPMPVSELDSWESSWVSKLPISPSKPSLES